MTIREREKMMKEVCQSMEKQILSVWGKGWTKLGEELRGAIIAERVLMVFASQMDGTNIPSSLIRDYLQSMRQYCGLDRDTDSHN
jgi:hypothetical protein